MFRMIKELFDTFIANIFVKIARSQWITIKLTT